MPGIGTALNLPFQAQARRSHYNGGSFHSSRHNLYQNNFGTNKDIESSLQCSDTVYYDRGTAPLHGKSQDASQKDNELLSWDQGDVSAVVSQENKDIAAAYKYS